MTKLLLIDGHALLYRAYHATSDATMSTSKGEPTNATYGVAAILQIDRTRSAGSIGQFLGFLAVAAVIGAGIYKGWLGAVTSVVAAVLLVPNWVDAMSNNNNRGEAALIALSTSVLIVVIGLLTMAAGLTNRPDQSAR